MQATVTAKQPRKRRWVIYAISGVLLAAIFIFIISFVSQARENQTGQQVQTGDVVTAFRGDLSASATASGQVTARREAGLSVEMPGKVINVPVRVGDVVAAGDVLVRMDTSDQEFSLAIAQQNLRVQEASLANLLAEPEAADVTAAEATVKSAQANLDALLDGPSAEEIAAADAGLSSAQASVASASASLGSAQDAIKESQILAAEAALLAASQQLDNAQETDDENPTEATYQALLGAHEAVASAQASLDDLREGPDTTAAQGNLNAATARLDGSQANYNLKVSRATDVQIATAESQLAQAQATLANLMDDPTAAEIAAAEANTVQAKISVLDAQDALVAATITAPFNGVITAVHVSEGEYAGGVVVELLDTSSLQVVLQVDEVDVGNLSVGQPAIISLETWPDAEIASEIATIAPSAQTSAGSALITYDVYLSLGETDFPVRVGMTADANLITAAYNDILLVPNRAIKADREKGSYSVNLVVGDTEQEIPVKIGARDDQNTQITSGLNAGDKILISDNLPTQSIGPGQEDDDGGPLPFGR